MVNSSEQKQADLLYSVDDYHGCLIYLNEAIIKGGIKSPRLTMAKGRCLAQLGRWDDARLQYLDIDNQGPLLKEAVIEGCLCCWLAKPKRNAAQIIEKIKIHDTLTYSFLKAINQNLFFQKENYIEEIDNDILESLLGL